MHWAQHRRYRTVFGVASFVPAICIAGLVAWAQRDPLVDRLLSFDFQLFAHAPRAMLIRFAVVFGLVVVLQMGMATIVALHLDKREDVSSGSKVMWVALCLFVGSIFLPIFYFKKLRRYRGS
jgi:hypothetical protein